MRTIPSINKPYILLLFLVSLVLFFSCNRKIPTIKEKNTNYELYSISPDGPFKLLINGTKIKTENAYCLNYEEQKFLSEYVSLDTLKINPKKAHKYHDTERCNIPFNEITLIEQFGNIKLYRANEKSFL